MRVKRAGIATKLLVLVLLAVLAAGLLSTQAKLTEARSARDELARQVEEQREANAALADDIAHSGDPEYLGTSPEVGWACWSRTRSSLSILRSRSAERRKAAERRCVPVAHVHRTTEPKVRTWPLRSVTTGSRGKNPYILRGKKEIYGD